MNVYACINNDTMERMRSSSGGLFAIIAKSILDDGGVVYAVEYDSNWNTVHCKITDVEELPKALGSKYIQSKLGNIFRKVERSIKEDRPTLFAGTPCQCAGLKGFLNKDYDNLFIVSVFCHGVPSRKVWQRYLATIDKKHIVSINMRDKTTGWTKFNYCWRVLYDNGKEVIKDQREVPFMKGFVNDLYLRPSCYHCRFKEEFEFSDISLGDYWGVWEYNPSMDDDRGTSVAILNTEKGYQMMKKISNNITMEAVDINKVKKYNPYAFRSISETPYRAAFFKAFNEDESINNTIEALVLEKNKREFSIGSLLAAIKGRLSRKYNE